VIVSSELLESMMRNNKPSRAEVRLTSRHFIVAVVAVVVVDYVVLLRQATDVANIVFEAAHAVMIFFVVIFFVVIQIEFSVQIDSIDGRNSSWQLSSFGKTKNGPNNKLH
jgi:hypothetical protein